ncbi:MAG TPA: tRNA lysidine(34) synthetase TilS, partial [Steroidobacteraceae bacterium]
ALLDARPDANPSVEWSSISEGAPADAPKRVRVQRDGDLLTLSQPVSVWVEPASADILWSWRESRSCTLPRDFGKLELEPDERGPIDLDALPDVLTIRWRAGGERLAPHRGGPHRSLKNLLQEARVPVAERARLPLLFSVTPDGAQLLAVADLLIDERVQPTSLTRRRARLFWTGAQRP